MHDNEPEDKSHLPTETFYVSSRKRTTRKRITHGEDCEGGSDVDFSEEIAPGSFFYVMGREYETDGISFVRERYRGKSMHRKLFKMDIPCPEDHKRSFFVAFEGLDRSGKTTQSFILEEILKLFSDIGCQRYAFPSSCFVPSSSLHTPNNSV